MRLSRKAFACLGAWLFAAAIALGSFAGMAEALDSNSMVWVSEYGSKYHLDRTCSGMKNPSQVTLAQAAAAGKTACEKCATGQPSQPSEPSVPSTPVLSFTDVNQDTPHVEDIKWLASAGISMGFPDGGFHPMAEVARADMAAFLRRQAAEMGVLDAAKWEPSQEDWGRFGDVHADTPHAKDILWLAHTGITTGFGDSTFRPLDSVARCDMAAFLYRLYSLKTTGAVSDAQPGAGENPFTDIYGSTPHVQEVLWLASNGISKGFQDGTFKAYNKVVRQDMAAFLHRLFNTAMA